MNETRIVELRRERGWTQEKLADECGVGVRTIQRLEAGSDASLETLSLVADALGVPVRDLFAAIESDELSGRVEWVPAADADDLEATGAEVVIYPGAEHGFVHDASRPTHRADDAADAWRRVAAFLG